MTMGTVTSEYIDPLNTNQVEIYAKSGPNTKLCTDGIYVADNSNNVLYSVLDDKIAKKTSHDIVSLDNNNLFVQRVNDRVSPRYIGTEDIRFVSYDKTTKLVNELKGYVGCTKDANKLYEYLSSQIEAIALWEDLYVYAYLINDQELGVSESLIRKNKAETLEALLLGNTSFFAPELLKLDRNEYEQLFINNPKLEEFRADLNNML